MTNNKTACGRHIFRHHVLTSHAARGEMRPIVLEPFLWRIALESALIKNKFRKNTRVGTLIVATIYLQLIQNRYMFRSFTLLHCSHQHFVQPVASDVEVVGYL